MGLGGFKSYEHPHEQALFTRAKCREPGRCTSVDELILPEPGAAQWCRTCLQAQVHNGEKVFHCAYNTIQFVQGTEFWPRVQYGWIPRLL